MRTFAVLMVSLAMLLGCSSDAESASASAWVEDEVSFVADGLTIHGTYRHRPEYWPKYDLGSGNHLKRLIRFATSSADTPCADSNCW